MSIKASQEHVIREVAPNVWIFSRPFARLGIFPFGGRSTAIKLTSGDVFVFVSTPLIPETKAKLDELGPVKYIVAPDSVHSLYISEFDKAYPEAKTIGVAPLVAKKKDIKFDGVYGVDPPETKYGFEDEITPCYFSGFGNNDVAFLHIASKSLIVADLLFNLPAKEQYSNSKTSPNSIVASSLTPWSGFTKSFYVGQSKDKAAMKRDATTVAGWDFERIIPCHGDVVEKDAKKAWTTAYEKILKF